MGFSRHEYRSCHSILQGIFPTQGLNPALLHCRQILYHLSHQGSPKSQTPAALESSTWRGLGDHWASIPHLTCHWKLGGDRPQVPLLSQERTVSSAASFGSSPNSPSSWPGLGPIEASGHQLQPGLSPIGKAAWEKQPAAICNLCILDEIAPSPEHSPLSSQVTARLSKSSLKAFRAPVPGEQARKGKLTLSKHLITQSLLILTPSCERGHYMSFSRLP